MIGPEIYDIDGNPVTPEPMMPLKTYTNLGPINVSHDNTVIVEYASCPDFVVVEHDRPNGHDKKLKQGFLAISIGKTGMKRLKSFGVPTRQETEIPESTIRWFDEMFMAENGINPSSITDLSESFETLLKSNADEAQTPGTDLIVVDKPPNEISNKSGDAGGYKRLLTDLGMVGIGLLFLAFERPKKDPGQNQQ